jgi:hypothetical protein
MRIPVLSTILALLSGVGAVLAQAPLPAGPASPPSPPTTTIVPGSAPVYPVVVGDAVPEINGDGSELGLTPEDYAPSSSNLVYANVEYLLWRLPNAPLPPTQLMVPFTISSLPEFNSTVAFPDGESFQLGGRSGARFTAGFWLDPSHTCAFEASYFQLERRQNSVISNQVATLPINLTVIQNIQQALATIPPILQIIQVPADVTLPGQLTVVANASHRSADIWGGEVNARSTRCYFGGVCYDLLAGFRMINFEETLAFNETIRLQVGDPVIYQTNGPVSLNNLPVIPLPVRNLRDLVVLTTADMVATRNRYYGAQVGGSFEWWFAERFFLEGQGKLGAGGMVQTVFFEGYTTSTTQAGGTVTVPGGLLSPFTGPFANSRTKYVIVPEFEFKLGFQITPWLRSTIGYNFMWISSVVRPGSQIGLAQNSATVVVSPDAQNSITTIQPTFRYQDTAVYMQGLTAGLEFRY